nr:transposase (putative), gypsy type [Tanacetum cinerariifolium]
MPASGTYSVEAVRVLDTHRTPIQKQPEAILCFVGISRRYYLGDDVYPTFHYDDDREMDLFGLIRAPNPTKVKTGSRPRAPHELPLLTLTAYWVIEMDEPTVATDSSEFTSEYGISEVLRPELPGPGDRIVDFPEGKVGVYTRFFEFANFRLPISQFLFDVLGYYQIHISQLSVIGAAKVKTGSRPRAPLELPLLTLTASRVIEMDEPAVATGSSG